MAQYDKKRICRAWRSMLRRCSNPQDNQFHNYGARGVKVCDKWKTLKGFLEDMQDTYDPTLTLDRINNDGNYEPSNCQWATPKQQANNRRTNRIITIDGITKTLAQWIDESGINSSTVRQRYYVYEWDIKRALGIGV